jgi:hypothetical protein
VGDIGRFVIGDAGYRALYGGLEAGGRMVRAVGSAAGARTLLRQSDSDLALCIYYPDSLISCLERHDPTRRLDATNVAAFAVLVEELDHFLTIVERYRRGGVLSLLELELHANVTKYLMIKLFLARLRRSSSVSDADTAWIRSQIFEAGSAEPDPALRARYRDAARLAARYVQALDGMPAPCRIPELRRFHRLSPQAKHARIASL